MPNIKIEDMDHYEILNVNKNASSQEIESAYLTGKAAYSQNSLALYTLLGEEERQHMLQRIERAFEILGDEKKRQAYNENILGNTARYKEKAHFRKSTKRVIFEDPESRRGRIPFFKRLFSHKKN